MVGNRDGGCGIRERRGRWSPVWRLRNGLERVRWRVNRVGCRDDGTNEAVATTGNRFDIARAVSRVSEHVPQAIDRFLQRQIIVNKSVFRPKESAEFFAGDQFTGAFEQRLEDLKGLACELEAD